MLRVILRHREKARYYYTTYPPAMACPNRVHFRTCFSFEQSLPKWMTTLKLWSRTFDLRLIARSLGGPSLGRSPDAQKQRRPFNQNQIRGK
jgi:hypothetical protein